MSQLINVSATGNVGPATGGFLNSVVLQGGSANSTAVLREQGSGGTIVGQFAAVIGDSAGIQYSEAHYNGQLHVTLAGTGASIDIEFA